MSNLLPNLWPILLVCLLVFAIWKAGQAPLWAEAYRRLRRNRMAMLSLFIITLYGSVAFLDSIGWPNKDREWKKIIDLAFEKPKER